MPRKMRLIHYKRNPRNRITAHRLQQVIVVEKGAHAILPAHPHEDVAARPHIIEWRNQMTCRSSRKIECTMMARSRASYPGKCRCAKDSRCWTTTKVAT
jgi:hypothetical protein